VFLQAERKGDSEEERRRPVARTLSNWLQAFCIYANILCQKHPEYGPGLFKHVDIILEAYKSYGGIAWYIYDDRFRQKMAIHGSLTWGSKDIDLWMGMLTTRSSTPLPTKNPTVKTNACWSFNESFCKWQSNCRYKHECSVCAGAHPAFRCAKRFLHTKPNSKEQPNKGDHAGEVVRNAPLPKNLSRTAEGSSN
ncbi:hypothetical protein XELAEV_18000143mg, partial [Xenopus laevis]